MKQLLIFTSLCLLSFNIFSQSNLSMEQRLTRLEDVDAIRTLLHSYGRYVDERNWTAFSELFSENSGTWNGGMGIATGRPAIVEMMESTIGGQNIGANGEGVSNLHLISNEFINVNANKASALSKWVFVMTAPDGGGPDPVYIGHYEDQLIKENGEWKFQNRSVFGDITRSGNLPNLQD